MSEGEHSHKVYRDTVLYRSSRGHRDPPLFPLHGHNPGLSGKVSHGDVPHGGGKPRHHQCSDHEADPRYRRVQEWEKPVVVAEPVSEPPSQTVEGKAGNQDQFDDSGIDFWLALKRLQEAEGVVLKATPLVTVDAEVAPRLWPCAGDEEDLARVRFERGRIRLRVER